jgi:hypothetical protein
MKRTRTQDQITNVLALRPRGGATKGPRTPLRVIRGDHHEPTATNVVDLSRRLRRLHPEHHEPQGGDAA